MKGAVLIITLWILAILAILSIGIGGRMGLELKLTGFERDRMAAYYQAIAGIERAEAVVRSEDHSIDSLNEKWSFNPEDLNPLFKDIAVADAGTFTVSYIYWDKRVFYGMQDEERRINVNSAPKETISRLISFVDPSAGDPDGIAENIEDWRDADAVNAGGSAEYSYTQEGYGRKDALFDSVDELILVNGMTADLLAKLRDYITVYPAADSGKVNINTAPQAVLYAIGLSSEDASEIVSVRAGADGLEGTEDDVIFDADSFAGYAKKLPAYGQALPDFASHYFRVSATGCSSDGRASSTVTCVVSDLGNILYWKED